MRVYMNVGNIGCGKSTIARKLARRENALIINNDLILTMKIFANYYIDDRNLNIMSNNE